MLKRLIAVAVAFTISILPACAQRGGGHAGSSGHSTGFASSAGFHSGFTAPVRSGGFAAPRFSGIHAFGPNPSQRFPSRITSPTYASRRPERGRYQDRFRRPYTPLYGVSLPYSVGYLGSSFLDYPDDLDTASYTQPPSANPQPVAPSPDDYVPPSYPYPDDESARVYRPAYQRQQPLPDPPPEQALTLIFKDGRPSQQIHNYLLTRTILYVQDDHLRQIPIDQLDLAETAKVNADAGIDFVLPKSIR